MRHSDSFPSCCTQALTSRFQYREYIFLPTSCPLVASRIWMGLESLPHVRYFQNQDVFFIFWQAILWELS